MGVFLDAVPPRYEAARVLEVGVGTGKDAHLLASRRPDAKVVGVDPFEAMLAYARQKERLPNLRWEQAAAEKLPFPSQRFDVVFSTNSILHFRDGEQGVLEMIRVLKPGGVLLVSELSAWVPFWSTLRAMRQTKLPWLLQPLIALSFRQETRKMMPPREVVEGWFVGHEDVDSDGVTHPSVGGAPAAFWFAYAVRRRNPGRSLGRGPA